MTHCGITKVENEAEEIQTFQVKGVEGVEMPTLLHFAGDLHFRLISHSPAFYRNLPNYNREHRRYDVRRCEHFSLSIRYIIIIK